MSSNFLERLIRGNNMTNSFSRTLQWTEVLCDFFFALNGAFCGWLDRVVCDFCIPWSSHKKRHKIKSGCLIIALCEAHR